MPARLVTFTKRTGKGGGPEFLSSRYQVPNTMAKLRRRKTRGIRFRDWDIMEEGGSYCYQGGHYFRPHPHPLSPRERGLSLTPPPPAGRGGLGGEGKPITSPIQPRSHRHRKALGVVAARLVFP